MSATPVRRVGILGVGRVGTALARHALRAGFEVFVAGSGVPQDIELIVEFTTPGATPLAASDVIARSDVVLLATPLHKYRTLPASNLAGKIVVDAMNYWVAANGTMAEFESATRGTSEIVQDVLPGARLVKTLNHISYQNLETDGRPSGTAGRRALGLASDDDDAKRVVAGVLDRLGYDSVDAGPLSAGRYFEPGTVIFDGSFTAPELQERLRVASLITA